ncbi:hypothetical protein EDD18DRAFT_1346559 [Armillaria luteobubalina]|uniref:F-box domain-containing protein n=1 Tax=Armillaria luteobubalina TaxID=153913 RepID=A0AA39QGQ5_9AGAR|nr:hypothetical protein EDD18DRAFT_1346559 [Armillaria luteobubalina]
MTSTKQSTSAFLSDLLSRYDWVSTSNRSPKLITLLSTNAIPTALQAAQLEASIEALDAPIGEIQHEIDLLRNATASLEAKMTRLKDIRRDYRAALSPIRRLLSEILVEILRWTSKKKPTSSAKHVFGFNVFKIRTGPWRLGQVCSSWRDAVQFLCPEIWSTLVISWIPAPKKDMLALLNRALERSRNHRLDFFFRYRGFSDLREDANNRTDGPEEMSQCFDLLLSHSKRWGSVELAIVPSFLPRLSLVRGRIDCVEDVYLTCAPYTMPETLDTFEIAPKLKTLELTGMHPRSYIPFPTENLVVFSDTRRLPEHDIVPKYLDIIDSVPKLLKFTCHHHSVVPLSPGPYHLEVVHQSLRTLSASLGGLICSLKLPALTEVTLASARAGEDVVACPIDALFHLRGLVERSRCSLTTLSFIDAVTDEILLPILQLCPQLVSLCFSDNQSSRASDGMMESLFIDMTETASIGDAVHHTLLPCLKELEILLDNVEDDCAWYLNVNFVEMIVSRRAPLGSQMLEYLRIDVIGRGFKVPICYDGGLEELNRLSDNGLELSLDIADWDKRVLEIYQSRPRAIITIPYHLVNMYDDSRIHIVYARRAPPTASLTLTSGAYNSTAQQSLDVHPYTTLSLLLTTLY